MRFLNPTALWYAPGIIPDIQNRRRYSPAVRYRFYYRRCVFCGQAFSFSVSILWYLALPYSYSRALGIEAVADGNCLEKR